MHAFHLFIYILHGRLLLVLLYSMSKLNNNGSKARYSNRPSLIVFDVIDDLVPTSAIFSISQPKNSLTAEPFLTCNDGKDEATERIFSLHYAFMCRSGTQVELPRRLAMSQVGLVDDHTLHQPCVQSLSFKSTLALWMPAHWAPSLWPTVAIPQRKKWHLPGGRITSGDLPLRTHGRTHTHTQTCL